MTKLFKMHGRVHGVGFRSFCESHARRLGIKGWARNVSDDHTVEVCIQGIEAKVEEMRRFLKIGPPGSRIEKFEEKLLNEDKVFSEFQIIYEGWK